MNSLRCPYSDSDFNALVDNELSPERRAAVVSYLRAHPEAGREAEAWRRHRQMLHNQFDAILSENVPVCLSLRANSAVKFTAVRLTHIATGTCDDVSMIAPAPMPPLPQPPIMMPRAETNRPWGIFIFGVAGALALALGMLLILNRDGALQDHTRYGRENAIAAAHTYRSFSNLQLEFISTDPVSLEKSLSYRLGYGMKLPIFTSGDWHPVGARIVEGADTAIAFVLYHNRTGSARAAIIAPGPWHFGQNAFESSGLHSVVLGFIGQTLTLVGKRPMNDLHMTSLP